MELNTHPATEPTPAQAEIAKRFEQATRAAVGYLETYGGPIAEHQRLPVAREMILAGLSVLDLGKSARIKELETQQADDGIARDALRYRALRAAMIADGQATEHQFDTAVDGSVEARRLTAAQAQPGAAS